MAKEHYRVLLERAKQGKLSRQEIDEVAAELQKENPSVDSYTLLHILGRSGATSYSWLIEKFLNQEDDPFLARLALQSLCTYWGMTISYLDVVARFVDGVSWDSSSDCQRAALSIAGEYLRNNTDKNLLQKLLEILEDEDEDRLVREVAFSAIARAMGKAYRDIPSAARTVDLRSKTVVDLIEQAKERLSNEEGTTGA